MYVGIHSTDVEVEAGQRYYFSDEPAQERLFRGTCIVVYTCTVYSELTNTVHRSPIPLKWQTAVNITARPKQKYRSTVNSIVYYICTCTCVMYSFTFLFSLRQVMPVSLLQAFDASELEFLTAGTLEIDIEDWKAHTEYRNGEYTCTCTWNLHGRGQT